MIENIAIQPATAEVQARIRASFERQGLMRHLGACLSDIGHGQVRIKLLASPEVSQLADPRSCAISIEVIAVGRDTLTPAEASGANTALGTACRRRRRLS